MQHPRWREGRLSTGFIAEEYKGGFKPRRPEGDVLDILAAVAVAIDHLEQRAPAPDHPSDARAGGALRRPPLRQRRRHAGAARVEGTLGRPTKVTFVDAKGIRRTTLDARVGLVARPAGVDRHGARPAACRCRCAPILNGYDLAYRGIRAKAYVYTEREAALAALMPEKVAARHLQAAALPHAGPGEGHPRRRRARRSRPARRCAWSRP